MSPSKKNYLFWDFGISGKRSSYNSLTAAWNAKERRIEPMDLRHWPVESPWRLWSWNTTDFPKVPVLYESTWVFLKIGENPPKSSILIRFSIIIPGWLVISTHLKNVSHNGNLPQVRVNRKNNGTTKSSILIYFNKVFHYKLSILGYPYFRKHPYHTCWGKKNWEYFTHFGGIFLFNFVAKFFKRNIHFSAVSTDLTAAQFKNPKFGPKKKTRKKNPRKKSIWIQPFNQESSTKKKTLAQVTTIPKPDFFSGKGVDSLRGSWDWLVSD